LDFKQKADKQLSISGSLKITALQFK